MITQYIYYLFRLTVNKETANKGRQFYGCSKSISASDRCTFFLWADQPTSNGPSNTQPNNTRTNTHIGRMDNSYRARLENS